MIEFLKFCYRKFSSLLSGLFLITGLVLFSISVSPNANAGPVLSWTITTLSGTGYGHGIATSSDGTKVFVGTTTRVFISTDSGVTYTRITALDDLDVPGYQVSVAMSTDGTKLYYAFSNKIYYSWNGGSTWSNTLTNSSNREVWNISASYDGTKILMTTRDGGIYTYSTNSGQTWTTVSDSYGGGWPGAISGDGSKIIIAERNTKNVATGSGIPRMGPLGGTLTAVSLGAANTGSYNDWRGAACDSTCTHIVLNNAQGGVFVSSDSGATWIVGTNSARSNFKNLVYAFAASNPDGSRLATAVVFDVNTDVYISTDYGVTWTSQNIGSGIGWEGLAISWDGNRIYSNAGNGYNPVKIASASFPTASTTVLTTQNASVVYGSSNTLTATISSNTATGTVDFKNNGTSITGCNAATVTAGVATCTTWKPSVGTYSNITAAYSGNGSLSSSSSGTVSLSVTQAPLSITASSPSVIYGASTPAITASYSGLVNGDLSSVVTGVICSTSYTTSSAAGSLPSTSCSSGTAGNYSISYVAGAVTINKATPTISLVLPSAATSATYGTAVTITATVSKPGAVTFYSAGTAITGCSTVDAATTTATCSWIPNVVNASTVLTADFVPNDSTNFANLSAAGSRTINVGKATLGVAASSHTVGYGSAIPTITPIYSGFANGDTSASVSGISCTTTYTTITPIGTTGSSCSGATSSNYLFSYTPGVVTIVQGAQTTALTVTSTTGTYGSNLSLTATGGSGGGSTSFIVDSGPCSVINTSTLTSTAAGTCRVTATRAANGNYLAASSASTDITINQATPTFNWNGVSKTYGATAFDLAAPTPSTPGTWTFSSATTSVISLNGTTATVAGAGTSVITATFTPNDAANYISGGTTTMTVTVGKATLGITASSHSVAFGDSIPTITPAYSGFVNGEDSSVLSNLTCSTSYTTTTAVGTIASNCSGATASNYIFAYTAGVITISQGGQTSALTINTTSVTYGSTLSLTTLGGNGSGANSFIVNSGPCSVSGDQLSTSAAGICMVTATKAANGNYLAASSASTEITVAKKNLTISGLTGVNKVFDGDLASTVTGTPSLVGVVGSDNVALTGTPTFAFATADVANTKPLTGSGYGLTNSSASNYTLTQPVVIANVTQKAARVIATNVTIASGATVTSSFTTSGLVTGDSVTAVTYSYSGTGTSTPPTAVGTYTITPSLADFGAGSIGNYSITYETATLTILAKYTTTYNANGGTVSGGSTSNVDFVVGDNALTLPTPTRANYTFTGWYTLQTNGTQVTGVYTPAANATLWAHWVQNSLYGMGNNTRIFSLTTIADVGNTYSANAAGGTVGIEYLANALPAGTVIDAYLLSDTSTATTLIGASNTYVMSLVLAWVATDGTVPTTAANKAISMTITNGAIKKGAKIYSVIGTDTTLLGIATVDGSATISITDDPQIIIAITKPDAPTGVSATSGGNAVSTVSWTAPANDGGSSITSYTAVSNAGQSCTTSSTSCQVTGLANGTSYTFTVTALNSIGVSDTSTASVAITPSAPAPAPVVTPTVVATPTVVSAPVVMITPTLTSLTFVENATKDGGKLVWAGTNIESVLYTGNADAYPAPYNYGAFTIGWGGQLANMVAGVTYTMKLEVRSSTGGSASKTIEYTIAKPVVDTTAADAALKAAQEKAAAEKKAAEEAAAAALKIAQEKALADVKVAAEAAALKIAQEKAAAEAKAAADAAALKIAQEKAAAEKKAAEEAAAAALKVAQEKAAAEAKAAEEAAALKVAEEKAAADAAALAIAKKTPVLNLFSAFSTAKYTSSQTAKMKKLTLKLEPATTLKCVGYINTKGTTASKAKAIALAQAKTTCASAKKVNPSITTVITTAALAKAPKPLVGASNTKAKYRVDLFAYKG